MNDYDFSTLNDKDFEMLVASLLSKKLGLNLQFFKTGKDKGIDIRYSSPAADNAIVVQAKHFLKSGYTKLKSVIKSEEVGKIRKLDPERYILATSIGLSAQNKDELKSLLAPFVLSSNDIIGREDLNQYLSEHRDVELKFFKLWFSSVNVLTGILNNAAEGRTKYLLDDIRRKGKLYVVTQKFDNAIEILLRQKLVLITGEPGIGKTTMANMLLFERAKKGHKVLKIESISEAEHALSINEDESQVFYIDDFLGSSYNEIVNSSTKETQLTNFVDRVIQTPNKYLILTTRTVILNQAVQKHEKINHSGIARRKFELKLSDYTKYEKAQILYNHLFFQQINDILYNALMHEGFYKRIVVHANYSPRIIEFITEPSRISGFSPEEYRSFIANSVNNPKEIWRYSFNNQIGYLDRCLILTLFSFENRVQEQQLIRAFDERLIYEKNAHNQIIKENQFDESVRAVLEGFVMAMQVSSQSTSRFYGFVNPSLADFLLAHVAESFPERRGILMSICYFEQLDRFNPAKNVLPLEPELQEIIKNKIASGSLTFMANGAFITKQGKTLSTLETIHTYCRRINADDCYLSTLSELNFHVLTSSEAAHFLNLMHHLPAWPASAEYLRNNFEDIIESVVQVMESIRQTENLPRLFEIYNKDYDEFSESKENRQLLLDLIGRILESEESSDISSIKSEIVEMSTAEYIYDDLESLSTNLQEKLFPGIEDFHDFNIWMDKDFWETTIQENIDREKYNHDYEEDNRYYDYKGGDNIRVNEDKAIEDLFNR